jgi:DNA polymerase-3 subunit delta
MIFYFYGENSYAIRQQVHAVVTQYKKKTGGSLEIERLDMSSQPLSDLLNVINVMPMFVSSRLLIVSGISTIKIEKTKLQAVIDSASQSTIVVFTDPTPDKRSIVFKTLSNLKNAKQFSALSQSQLLAWVKKQIQAEGGEASDRTINVLIEKVGNNQWQLKAEVQKLVSYNAQITPESINVLVVPNVEYSVFVMTDSILRGQTNKAIEIYKQLLTQGEPDQKILGAIVYQYRVLALAKIHEGQSQSWTKTFGVAPFAATKAQNMVRNIDLDQIKSAYHLIVEADMAIKTGQKTSNASLEDLIIGLSQLK